MVKVGENKQKQHLKQQNKLIKIPYFQFEGEPSPDIIKKIQEYSERYGIDYVIDTKPLGVKN